MHHLIVDLSDGSLQRLVTSLEARIIAGTASGHDIETYLLMQLELASREFGHPDPAPDPRD